MTRTRPTPKGEPLRYLLEHMYDGCCDVNPWPYSTSGSGYPQVTEDGVRKEGHRFVCEMMYGPPQEGEVTRHLCGKGHLGCFNADCLEWGSKKDNAQDSIDHGTQAHNHGEQHGCTVVSTRDVERMRKLYATRRYIYKELAEMFGISKSQAGKIVNNKSRRNG